MATSESSFVLFFLLLLPFPWFSSSCETTLPCNGSIEIKPPFFIDTPNTSSDCGKYLVLCDVGVLYIYIYFAIVLPLESIAYETNTIRVRDPSLSRSLQQSNCSNLCFDFPDPVSNFNSQMYSSLNTEIASIRCNSTNLAQSPPNIFGKGYNLNFSSTVRNEDSNFLKECSNNHSVPSFELTLLFNYVNRDISLKSANYSYQRLAKPGCFTDSTPVLACDQQCKG